jgi:exosortase/archaeosortase family protein
MFVALQELQQRLQEATGALAQQLLGAAGTPLVREGERLRHAAGFVAEVDLGCTALAPALVLIAALVMVGKARREPPFRLALAALVGAGIIGLVNEIRLAIVLWTGVHAPERWFWVHDLLGPFLLLGAGAAIIATWMMRSPAEAAR